MVELTLQEIADKYYVSYSTARVWTAGNKSRGEVSTFPKPTGKIQCITKPRWVFDAAAVHEWVRTYRPRYVA